MKAGTITLPEGYVKELRQFVKKNKSGYQIYHLLNDIYQSGYKQAVLDFTERAQRITHAVDNLNNGNDANGIESESEGSIVGTGEGTASGDSDSAEGSESNLQESDGTESGPV